MGGEILVIGATGTVGTPLVAELLAKGERVKAASRKATAVRGAEAVALDIASPAAIDAALDGVDRMYLLVPAGHLNVVQLTMPLIEAAARRKVKVVMQSVFGVDADDRIPYRQVELALINSGTPYVILRPNWFADNFHSYWIHGVKSGTIAVPAAEGKTSFIDARDIAASAAAALTSSQFDGKAFNLTDPEALDYGEAAAVLSRVIGRRIGYQPIDDESFIQGLTGAGIPPDYAGFLASIFHPVREGWTAAISPAVRELTGKEPRSLETYARDHKRELG